MHDHPVTAHRLAVEHIRELERSASKPAISFRAIKPELVKIRVAIATDSRASSFLWGRFSRPGVDATPPCSAPCPCP